MERTESHHTYSPNCNTGNVNKSHKTYFLKTKNIFSENILIKNKFFFSKNILINVYMLISSSKNKISFVTTRDQVHYNQQVTVK